MVQQEINLLDKQLYLWPSGGLSLWPLVGKRRGALVGMTLSELGSTYDLLKTVDAVGCAYILGVAVRLAVAGRLGSIAALRQVLQTPPFASLVPWIGSIAWLSAVVAALGFVVSVRGNSGALEVFNDVTFPLAAAVIAAIAGSLSSDPADPAVSRTRRR